MSEFPSAPAYEEEARPKPPAAAEAQPEAAAPEPPGMVVLQGEQANIYLDMLRRLIKAGRLNQFYPNPNALDHMYRLMSPATNFGLDNVIKLNPRNGMPSEPDIGRVLADKDASVRFLSKNDLPEMFERTDEASQRLQKRLIYYRDVSRCDLPRRFQMDTKVRQVDQTRRIADFITLFERYDPGEGIFTRYTVSLLHMHQRWNRVQIELAGDDLKYTEDFRNVISRYHSDEAEFAFILLSEVAGIKVKEVVRARVGPLWFKGAAMPPEIAELLEDRPGNFILNFPLERVEVSEKSKEDLNLDPFGRFYRTSLSPEARALADARAEELGYRVYKERKFSCTKGIADAFKKLLADRGAKCVVYPV